ncbi:hypothetical protein AQUCO_04400060v1, partial [Aquilegia coerulea]
RYRRKKKKKKKAVMGIPAFYRLLLEKYPNTVVDVIEESSCWINGVEVPVDLTNQNPNGFEFDNLYLDMNGIIHPCFHPSGPDPPPNSYEEVFKAIFKYIDRIFSIVRPRKVLFMAIDGVAPRAKMNQQRTRRFRAAKDAADAAAEEEKLRSAFETEREKLSVLQNNSQCMDSNIITPGTEFMASLSSALQYYIHLRMNTDPGWHDIKVILSDANVAGEGEHKIMAYIRLQRNLRGFDPNTRHCLYGLDADLIMLALATHEIHFSILREDVRKPYTGKLEGSKKLKLSKPKSEEVMDYISRQHFQFFNIWVLREYLKYDMRIPNLKVRADLERVIDDFVFMCVLVGNDFLPHVPTLEISEGAIDLLMSVYKKEFVKMGGYLTDSYKVNLKHVEHFIQAVGLNENGIFRRRSQVQKEEEKRFQGGKHFKVSSKVKRKKRDTFWSSNPSSTDSPARNSGAKDVQKSVSSAAADDSNTSVYNSGAKELQKSVDSAAADDTNKRSCAVEVQKSVKSAAADDSNKTVDNIKLGQEGWKERYYAEKFDAKTDDERDKIQKHAVLKYIEGMCWVMHYYYEGVCSWQWFYPYHYAPFASDFIDLERLEIHFSPGKPFKPFDQLMGVLPAASAHALPLCYRELMTDASSPILDFYPTDFELDMNGKSALWQAICKLPFIEESRLLAEIAKVEHTLTDEEKRRNSMGMDILFIHTSHPLGEDIMIFWERNKDHPKLAQAKVKRRIDPKLSGGMNGFMYLSDRPACPLEINSSIEGMEEITMNKVISVFYKYPTSHPHIPRPPEGVVMPMKSVRKADIVPASNLWHEKSAVLERLQFDRPVVKSISASCLAKLAHRLVYEYYAEKMKENVDPSVINGLIATEVPSCPNSRQRFDEMMEENVDPSVINGLIATMGPSCPTCPNSRQRFDEMMMYDASSVNVKKSKTKGSEAAVTKRRKKKRSLGAAERKRSRVAAVERSQENGEPSILDRPIGTSALSLPIQPNPNKRAKPEEKESDVATEPGKRKRRRKAAAEKRPAILGGDIAVDAPLCPTQSVEEKMDNENLPNTTEPEKNKSDTADTKLGKRRRRHRAARENKKENMEPVNDGHNDLDAPSLPTQLNSREKENMEPVDDGYIGLDAPSLPTQLN